MTGSLNVRLAARCEAAGRPENEDNFQIVEDLSLSNVGFTSDKIFALGDKGTLLLVCDGMGGMNAGEVASAVAVKTITDFFSSENLTPDIFSNDETILSFVKRAIVKADAEIKHEASLDERKQGMGSTAVLVWLLGQKAYVGWCGDSRIYLYRPSVGLSQMSHDHSYVQGLVDSGKLSPDLAFDHPNKNIITRSLGDPRGAAQPDVKAYSITPGDIIMLCSDGLHDALRDSEIERTMAKHQQSMTDCRDALWNTSRNAGWHDNVTVIVAQIVTEDTTHGEKQNPQNISMPIAQPISSVDFGSPEGVKPSSNKGKSLIYIVASIVAIFFVIVIGVFMFNKKNDKHVKDRADEIVLVIQTSDDPSICEKAVENLLSLEKFAGIDSIKNVVYKELQNKSFMLMESKKYDEAKIMNELQSKLK